MSQRVFLLCLCSDGICSQIKQLTFTDYHREQKLKVSCWAAPTGSKIQCASAGKASASLLCVSVGFWTPGGRVFSIYLSLLLGFYVFSERTGQEKESGESHASNSPGWDITQVAKLNWIKMSWKCFCLIFYHILQCCFLLLWYSPHKTSYLFCNTSVGREKNACLKQIWIVPGHEWWRPCQGMKWFCSCAKLLSRNTLTRTVTFLTTTWMVRAENLPYSPVMPRHDKFWMKCHGNWCSMKLFKGVFWKYENICWFLFLVSLHHWSRSSPLMMKSIFRVMKFIFNDH